MASAARGIYDAGDCNLPNAGEAFFYPNAGQERPLSQGNVADVPGNAQGGINGNNIGVRMFLVYFLYCVFQIQGMDGIFQGSIHGNAGNSAGHFLGQRFPHQGPETVAGGPVGADAEKY